MKKVVLLMLIALSNLSHIKAQNLLTDLRPGLDGSEPVFDNAFQRNNELYFVANPDGLTSRLYKTDGTSGNTVVLEGGSNLYVTMLLGFLGNDLLYVAGDIYQGESLGLYKTNGSVAAGELILSFNQPGSILVAYPMTITMDNVLYFYGSDEVAGFELWRTDGTGAGTYMVKDINPGIESSLTFSPIKQYFAQLNGFIYFAAAEPVNGCELWKSDGTEAGTTLVANIDTSEAIIPQLGSNPAYFCTYNNEVYFSAFRPVDGRELWKTDGTAAGTVLVKDFASGGGFPSNLIEYNGLLYFTANTPNQGYTLYKSNGTTNGTVAVKLPSNGGPNGFPDALPVIFKGKLFFAADDANGSGIWYSDGTAAGTSKLPDSPAEFNSAPGNLLATSNYLYYTASNDLNGNSNTGVYRTTEISNQNILLTTASFNANDFQSLYLVNGCLLVRGDDNGATGEEIYQVCNQITQPVGLEENDLAELDLFPNPCTDVVQVDCPFPSGDIQAVFLNKLSGEAMKLTYVPITPHSITINGLSDFSPGMYLLSILTSNGKSNQLKLVIE